MIRDAEAGLEKLTPGAEVVIVVVSAPTPAVVVCTRRNQVEPWSTVVTVSLASVPAGQRVGGEAVAGDDDPPVVEVLDGIGRREGIAPGREAA